MEMKFFLFFHRKILIFSVLSIMNIIVDNNLLTKKCNSISFLYAFIIQKHCLQIWFCSHLSLDFLSVLCSSHASNWLKRPFSFDTWDVYHYDFQSGFYIIFDERSMPILFSGFIYYVIEIIIVFLIDFCYRFKQTDKHSWRAYRKFFSSLHFNYTTLRGIPVEERASARRNQFIIKRGRKVNCPDSFFFAFIMRSGYWLLYRLWRSDLNRDFVILWMK